MNQPIVLDDKVALVTGGASGLGEASAIALAKCGANVVIADKDVENGERVAKAVEALGRQALFVPTEMMDGDQIAAMIAKADERFGKVNFLINNVGGTSNRPFEKMSANSIDRHIALNLKSMLLTTQGAIPLMRKGGGGVIINVSSIEGLRAAPGFAVYAACKAAMISFTKTMALELADDNIRSFALAPDMINTQGIAALTQSQSEEAQASRDRYIPLRRMGEMEDFGNVVAFLASDMAAYLNGVVIPVDAGANASSGWFRSVQEQWVLYP